MLGYTQECTFDVGNVMKLILPFFLLMMTISTGASEIYRWVDDQGKVHFSDQAPEEHQSESLQLKINTYESVTYESLNIPLPKSTRAKKVIMYSAVWCGVCAKAKRYFEHKGIPYTDYDIETSEQGKRGFKQLNGKGVPIILVGNQRMNGFSPSGFEKLYQ